VDDYAVVRLGLRTHLAGHRDWLVCGEAENGVEAISKARALQPDVVILDINMPVLNGIQAAVKIREVSPTSKILLFSVHDKTVMSQVLSSSGADGCVSKAATNEELLAAIANLLPQAFRSQTRKSREIRATHIER